MIPNKAQEILDFWFKETTSEMRFKKNEDFDKKIKDKFLKDYELACQNEYDDWQDNILEQQFKIMLRKTITA